MIVLEGKIGEMTEEKIVEVKGDVAEITEMIEKYID
jgi:hypothetical protein